MFSLWTSLVFHSLPKEWKPIFSGKYNPEIKYLLSNKYLKIGHLKLQFSEICLSHFASLFFLFYAIKSFQKVDLQSLFRFLWIKTCHYMKSAKHEDIKLMMWWGKNLTLSSFYNYFFGFSFFSIFILYFCF